MKWGWYQKSEMVHLFLHFLLLANHEDDEWQGKIIKRGQFITGLKKLNQQTRISTQSIRTCISRLKSTNEITNKSTNKNRLITIINYEQYQQDNKKSTSKITSRPTNNQQTTNNQLTSNKKDKEDKNISSNEERKDISIIKLFASKKNIREITQPFIKRNIRAAIQLKDYPLNKIEEVMEWLKENADFKWTLETIGKYIDEDLSKLKGQNNNKWL